MEEKDLETFCPSSKAEWRAWLQENHQSKSSIWLIYYRVATNIPSLTWSEAVDEALCFGWIDSTKKSIDKEKYKQYFTKRKPKSPWSKVNKDKVEQLLQDNLMTPAGLKTIEIAKENGSWTLLDAVEALIVPEDLQLALEENQQALEFFQSQSKSVRKGLLYWITMAKRPATRKKRIDKIVELTAQGIKPTPFGKFSS